MSLDIVHIFTDEGLYTQKFLFFVESNFNISNNLFVFRKRDQNFVLNKKNSTNVSYIVNFLSFIFQLTPKLLSTKKIIIHYLPIGPSLFIWYLLSFLLKKTTWVLWGSDLYFYKDRSASFKDSLYEYLRKRIIRKIPVIACFIKGDYEMAKTIYKTKAAYIPICYPLPTDFHLLERIKLTHAKSSKKRILVGNSASRTNNHLDILEKLSFLKNEEMEIICPLSYADENEYSKEVINVGNYIFNQKFLPLTELISSQNYAIMLDSVSCAVMNHERQQGLGNILSLLFLGKKVFLRKETTSFKFLEDWGIKIFPFEDIPTNDIDSFFHFPESYQQLNYNILQERFSTEKYISMWTPIFGLDKS